MALTTTEKTADEWFAEYGVSHRHPVNKNIHRVCVPLIVVSLMGLLWEIPFPGGLDDSSPFINWATVAVLLAFTFYLRLSPSLAVEMLLYFAFILVVIAVYNRAAVSSVWLPSLLVFALAWIGQFVGHKVEGRKPSFFKDLQFLLIAPAWLLAELYRCVGIRY